jgi:hypothetical protein
MAPWRTMYFAAGAASGLALVSVIVFSWLPRL